MKNEKASVRSPLCMRKKLVKEKGSRVWVGASILMSIDPVCPTAGVGPTASRSQNPASLCAKYPSLCHRSSCHPERSRGTPDLLRRRKMHLNHASSDVFGARSVAEGESAGIQKDQGSLGCARDDTKKRTPKKRT